MTINGIAENSRLQAAEQLVGFFMMIRRKTFNLLLIILRWKINCTHFLPSVHLFLVCIIWRWGNWKSNWGDVQILGEYLPLPEVGNSQPHNSGMPDWLVARKHTQTHLLLNNFSMFQAYQFGLFAHNKLKNKRETLVMDFTQKSTELI